MTRILPWHQRHHADVLRRTRKLSMLARAVYNDLIDLHHMGELKDREADNDRAWMNRLELASWKAWRSARDELVRTGMICTESGIVSLLQKGDGIRTESKRFQNEINSEAKNASDFNGSRPSTSTSPSQSAYQEVDSSSRSPTHAHRHARAADPEPAPRSADRATASPRHAPTTAEHDVDVPFFGDEPGQQPHWHASNDGFESERPPLSVYTDELESIPY